MFGAANQSAKERKLVLTAGEKTQRKEMGLVVTHAHLSNLNSSLSIKTKGKAVDTRPIDLVCKIPSV